MTIKRILFICPYPRDRVASQRFRFEQYLEVLESNKIDIAIAPFWSENAFENLYSSGNFFSKGLGFLLGFLKRFFLLFSLETYQLIFIHREALPLGPPIWEWIAKRVFRKKMIYDFDDAIWLKNTSKENSLASGLKWPSKVNWIIKNSDQVFAGNNWLAQHSQNFNKNVEVIPTTIDLKYHVPSEKQMESLVIGWTGTHSTLIYLKPILKSLQKILGTGNVEFMIISDRDPKFNSVNYTFKRFSLETEIQDLDKIDIGLMPLPDSNWAKGKCGFKLLQYMAMAKASVGSPVGLNKDILGNNERGLIANNVDDWGSAITRLIQNQELREELGMKGREFVRRNYSRESLLPKWEKLILAQL